MNKQSKFTAMVFIAALAAGPLAMAEDAAPVTPDVSICEIAPEIAVCPGPCILPEPTEILVITDPTLTEPTDICVLPPPEEPIPTDWVKRGEGDGDVSVMYMAGGAPAVLEKTSRELGQDDKVAAVETTATAAAPAILSEKKEPVALIKEGRVFLR